MEFKRCSGILMPISSLPGGYGIGSMGKPAHDFVDFLAKRADHLADFACRPHRLR